MLAQKIIIEQIIKALSKKSKNKAKDIEEKIDRLFKIQLLKLLLGKINNA